MKKLRIQSNEEFIEMFDEFKSESDRATVILAAAKMDAMLYLLISKHLRPITIGRDELLDGDSALGTFSARINLAYRLGLINAHFTKSLHIVRKIRNSFAHEAKSGSLNSGGHSDRIRELLIPFKDLDDYQSWKKKEFVDENSLGNDFRLISAIIIVRLGTAINYASYSNVKNDTELVPPNWSDKNDKDTPI